MRYQKPKNLHLDAGKFKTGKQQEKNVFKVLLIKVLLSFNYPYSKLFDCDI